MLTLGIRQSAVTMVLLNFPVCLLHECNIIFTRAVSSFKEGAGDRTAHHPWGGRIPDLSIAPLKGNDIKILLFKYFYYKNLLLP